MKPREQRRAVMIRARMRVDAIWSDIVIHNISSRGLMVQGEQPPAIGSYIEIRRGQQIIIGRVVWRTVRNFGVMTQDRIDMEALVQEPGTRRVAPAFAERRSDPQRLAADMEHRAERSREAAALFQYILIAVMGVAAASLAASEVYTVLARPFATAAAHLPDGG